MAAIAVQEGERPERRHIRLPADSVSMCAENLGIQPSQEVTSSLVEDVSFRIRQLTDVSMHVGDTSALSNDLCSCR